VAPTKSHRPDRADVARALLEVAILWRPYDSGKDTAAGAVTQTAAEDSKEHSKCTAAGGEPQRRAA
jgi:hypothetical protein